MARCRAEFIVEPFAEGNPGPHVAAAVAATEAAGLAPDVGPFGTSIEGTAEMVLGALHSLVEQSLAKGASRISMQVTVVAD